MSDNIWRNDLHSDDQVPTDNLNVVEAEDEIEGIESENFKVSIVHVRTCKGNGFVPFLIYKFNGAVKSLRGKNLFLCESYKAFSSAVKAAETFMVVAEEEYKESFNLSHPELREGEMWFSNKTLGLNRIIKYFPEKKDTSFTKEIGPVYDKDGKRHGVTAYDVNGKKVLGLRPVFCLIEAFNKRQKRKSY